LLAELTPTSKENVEQALQAATALNDNPEGPLPLPHRIEILLNAARIMASEKEQLALLATREGGKPLIDSRIEVERAIEGLHLCVEGLRRDGGHVVPMNLNSASAGKFAFTQKQPIGVVVAVSAFNHPLNLIVHQLAPAVAVGCPVIVKPADDTPLSCLRFVAILHEAGLPEAWCQALVIPDLALAESLVSDPRVALFSFIGSARVGWMLRSLLAPGTRCLLEHGGAAPAIVFADADITATVKALTKGAFYHSGQVCVSVQRVYVHADIAKVLAEQLANAAGTLIVGDPKNDATDIGPLIRPREVKRVDEWVQEAISLGAVALCGAQVKGRNHYLPTVLTQVPEHCSLSRKEVFGPVVCLYTFEDPAQAFRQANDLPFAFQAAVFTQNLQNMMSAFHGLQASAVMVNEHTAFRTDWMPLAGLKQSGLGIGGIEHTMKEMQTEKMLVLPSF